MNNELKPIPQFNNEDAEQTLWETHDSTEYIDWSKAEHDPVFSHLKRSTDDENMWDTEVGTDLSRPNVA